jgi:hypothetical protein
MFVPIVQISMTKRPRDAAVEAARKSAPRYYLNGEAGGGGDYLWAGRVRVEGEKQVLPCADAAQGRCRRLTPTEGS